MDQPSIFQRRPAVPWLLWTGATLALATALSGCGRSEEAPGKAAPVAASAPPPEPLKIAFAYAGPIDNGGWSLAHDNGRKAVQAEFGDRVVTNPVERVPEGLGPVTAVDAETVFLDVLQQGNSLVFGTAPGFSEAFLKVAAEHPKVKFEHATGDRPSGNVRTYDSRTYEGAYLAGIVAGSMTWSNLLGVVGTTPKPEVIRNVNAFTLGALSVNPKVRTRVIWVDGWFNPAKEAEAAKFLIDMGADVLLQNTSSSAVLQTAAKAGKYAIGWDADMTTYASEAHLASAVVNWAPYYIHTTRQVLDGTWKGGQDTWWGVKEGAVDIVSISDKVPDNIKSRIEAVKAGLREGSFSIWKGPIHDQSGEQVIGADDRLEDADLRSMMFYVRGVDSDLPAVR